MADLLDHPDLTAEQRKNLILNYLPADIDEEFLKNLFSNLGAVEYVRIIRDRSTQRSMGYAFAKYYETESADKAVVEFDGYQLGDKVMRVNYARPPSEKIKNTNIYIANFPTNFTESEITKICEQYGRIISYKLLLDGNNQSRGIAFCRYDTNQDAQNAIAGLNGNIPSGGSLPLQVKLADKPSDKYNKMEMGNSPMYIPGMTGPAVPMTNQRFPNPAAAHGHCNPVMASPHPSGNPRQIIFGRDHPLGGHFNSIPNSVPPHLNSIAQAAFSPLQGWCVYLCNLPPTMDEFGLYKLIAPFGAVSSTKCMSNPDGSCKGISFVNMPHYEEAALAIKALNGTAVQGAVIQVEFKKGSVKSRQS